MTTLCGSETKKKAAGGAVYLASRQALVQILGIITGIVLARLLSPSLFGLYAVFTFQFALQLAIGDLGLGASVVRQKSQPSLAEFRSIQAFRQMLDLVQLIVVWFLAPWLSALYGFGDEAVAGFQLVALAVCLQSFQMVPTVKLERELRFGPLMVVEVGQAFVFSCCCIVLSSMSYGPLAFGVAWCAFSVTGVVLVLFFAPWRISWRFDVGEMKRRLSFGVPFQGAVFVALLRDSFIPIGIGFFMGAASVGYMNWAHMLALSFALGSLVFQRALLPFFAHSPEAPGELARRVEFSLKILHAFVAPLAVALLVLVEPTVLIVFGEKWMSALPIFYILWIANLFIPTFAVLSALLNALGKTKVPFFFVSCLAGLTWLLGVPFLLFFGLTGFALAFVLVQGGVFAFIARAKREVSFRVLRAVAPPWAYAFGMGAALFLAARVHRPERLIELCMYGMTALLVYFIVARLTFLRNEISNEKQGGVPFSV